MGWSDRKLDYRYKYYTALVLDEEAADR